MRRDTFLKSLAALAATPVQGHLGQEGRHLAGVLLVHLAGGVQAGVDQLLVDRPGGAVLEKILVAALHHQPHPHTPRRRHGQGLAQAPHMDVDGALVDVDRLAPDIVEQLPA